MEPSIEQQLRTFSKDEASFIQLKELYRTIENEKADAKQHLNLLENAIKNDYDSIMITDIDLEKPGPKIVYVNEGFTKITGYSRDEVIGKTPRILQGPKTDKSVLKRLKKRLKEGRAFFGQAVNYRKDGTEFVNQWDIHPMTDENGNLNYWVSYQHDITERKRAEKVLIDTKHDFDSLRKQSKSIFIDVDTTGIIVSCNKAFRSLTGYHKDELNGKTIWEFFPKKYQDSLKGRFDDFKKNDFHNQSFRGIIFHKEGFPIQVEGSSKVLALQKQSLIRADIKNISLQKRVMKTLQKRNKTYHNIVSRAAEFTYQISMQNDVPVVNYVSDAFETATDHSRQEVEQPGGLKKIIHADDLEKVQAYWEEVSEGNNGTCEYRIKNSKGDFQRVIDSAKRTHSKNGTSIHGAVSFLESGDFIHDAE